MVKRQLIAFTKDLKKVATIDIPVTYLQTEQDWINKTLRSSPHIDGMVLLVDWDYKTIIQVRSNDE